MAKKTDIEKTNGARNEKRPEELTNAELAHLLSAAVEAGGIYDAFTKIIAEAARRFTALESIEAKVRNFPYGSVSSLTYTEILDMLDAIRKLP